MPCLSCGGGSNTTAIERASGGICGVFTVLESEGLLDKILKKVDWKQAGVTRKTVEAWWEEHKECDRADREYEKEQAELKRIKAAALKKLSKKEREALKIRDED